LEFAKSRQQKHSSYTSKRQAHAKLQAHPTMIFIRRQPMPFHQHQGPSEACRLRRQQFFNHLLEQQMKEALKYSTSTTAEKEGESVPEDKKEAQEETSGQSSTYLQRGPVQRRETEEDFTFAFDLPGFNVDDLQVSVEDHVLSLFGKRQNKIGDTFVVRRSFALGKSGFDEDNIQANLSEGVLEITIPKKPEPKARLIHITTKNDDEPDEVDESAAPEIEKEEDFLVPLEEASQTGSDGETVSVETVEDAEDGADDEEPEATEAEETLSAPQLQEETTDDAWEEVTHKN
jgi:HSP20 family molecular chaperone IbpA